MKTKAPQLFPLKAPKPARAFLRHLPNSKPPTPQSNSILARARTYPVRANYRKISLSSRFPSFKPPRACSEPQPRPVKMRKRSRTISRRRSVFSICRARACACDTGNAEPLSLSLSLKNADEGEKKVSARTLPFIGAGLMRIRCSRSARVSSGVNGLFSCPLRMRGNGEFFRKVGREREREDRLTVKVRG